MKFEEIESTWALQQPVAPAVDLTALKKSLQSQLGRRKRMLVIAGLGALFGLVAMQAIFLVGQRAPQPDNVWVSVGRFALHQGISLVFLIEIVRVFLRHRRLAGGQASSVREVVTLSLASVEGEMTDYRMGGWMLLVLAAHSFFSIYLNQPNYGTGLDGFAIRVAIMVTVYGLIGVVCWRHYHRVLTPRREQLKDTVQQLDGET